MLPFSANPAEEVGEKAEPGHAESAPLVFRPWPILIRTTLVATILMVVFYGIYRTGMLNVDIPDSAMNRIP